MACRKYLLGDIVKALSVCNPIRVAYFTDAFLEPNGVASLSREFVRYAQRHEFPMLVVRGSNQTRFTEEGCVSTLEVKRGPASFRLDQDLYCDPIFARHMQRAMEEMERFRADVVHITGPGDMGIFGARIANLCRKPLVASWHTNLHEYAGRRIRKGLGMLPAPALNRIAGLAEDYSLKALLRFYRMAQLTMAPNKELVTMLQDYTKRPCCLMLHGVDLERFHPQKRTIRNGPFTIGYVGRLTAEKNVRQLAAVERELDRIGVCNYRFLVVGSGSEGHWLQQNMQHLEMPGVLRGEDLAAAFANMDAFLFPSETDTFGLVILEAMASGVPVVVTRGGGPQYQVEEGVTGFVVDQGRGYAEAIARLQTDPALRMSMGCAARRHACENSWKRVFDQVHSCYRQYLFPATEAK